MPNRILLISVLISQIHYLMLLKSIIVLQCAYCSFFSIILIMQSINMHRFLNILLPEVINLMFLHMCVRMQPLQLPILLLLMLLQIPNARSLVQLLFVEGFVLVDEGVLEIGLWGDDGGEGRRHALRAVRVRTWGWAEGAGARADFVPAERRAHSPVRFMRRGYLTSDPIANIVHAASEHAVACCAEHWSGFWGRASSVSCVPPSENSSDCIWHWIPCSLVHRALRGIVAHVLVLFCFLLIFKLLLFYVNKTSRNKSERGVEDAAIWNKEGVTDLPHTLKWG